MGLATVSYQVATYSGEIKVNCTDDEDNDTICARAKSQLRRRAGELPFGYERFTVVRRDYDEDSDADSGL